MTKKPGPDPRQHEEFDWVDPALLVPWAQNPRINDAAVDAVAKSVEASGWGAPLVVRRSDRRVIAGHTRRLAALKRGDQQVPVRWVELDDEAAIRLALADNKLAAIAEWDPDSLLGLLDDGVDLGGAG